MSLKDLTPVGNYHCKCVRLKQVFELLSRFRLKIIIFAYKIGK